MNFQDEVEILTSIHSDFETNGSGMNPMCICYRDGIRLGAIVCRSFTDDDKEKAFREVFSFARQLDPDEIIFAADSWMMMYDESTVPDDIIRPSQDPHKKECLQVLHLLENGDATCLTRMYVRDDNGCPYYIRSRDFESDIDPVMEGIVPTLIYRMWDLKKPDIDIEKHKDLLVEAGHQVHIERQHG